MFYLEWLANTVVEKWQIYVNFIDLNKACPKEPFPICRIDQLVDATVGHPRMSFLDAFQGYHQILLAVDNAGATYQRIITRMLEPQLGKNIEIYIDDMVVKSKAEFEHVNDLGNIFDILRRHKLRLNASKCSFGVKSRKFLGYMVTHRGIEVNLDQIKAINDL